MEELKKSIAIYLLNETDIRAAEECRCHHTLASQL